MKRYLLGPLMVLLVLLFSEVGSAATLSGTSAPETITGTSSADTINATQGGADKVFGNGGNDTIRTDDGVADDTVDCGGGTDKATVDQGDSTTACDGNVTRIPISTPPSSPPPSGDVTCPTGGVSVSPSDSLVSAAANNPNGTTFCLQPGTYKVSQNIVAKDSDRFLGLSTDKTAVKITTNATSMTYTAPENGGSGSQNPGSTVDHVFVGASNLVLENLDISGAYHDNNCPPNGAPKCGRGLGNGGSNMVVRNVAFHNNENSGIGGPGSNLLVENSEFYWNGNFDSARDPSGSDPYPVSAAGLKTVSPATVNTSNFHDNYWNGYWCDIDCGATKITNSTFKNNGKAGIDIEISSGPTTISGNAITGNGLYPGANRHSGLLCVSCANLDAFSNTFGSNVQYGVEVIEDSRAPVVSNVKVHDNTMNGDVMKGCSVSGVSCMNNS